MAHQFQGPAYLAPDILERIFFHARPGPYEVSTALSVLRFAPGNVSQVCRSWRYVALGRMKLWTSVKIVTDVGSVGRLEKGVRLVEEYILRSGPILPLDITVNGCKKSAVERDVNGTGGSRINMGLAVTSMHQYMRLIQPVRDRLRHLELRIPMSVTEPSVLQDKLRPWTLENMPNLEHLALTYPPIRNSSEAGTIDLSACSTRIRKCHISGCFKVRIAEGLRLENLAYLHFDLAGCRDSALVANWYDILRRTTRLQKLAVVIRNGLDWTHHPIQPHEFSVKLLHLHTLHVRFTVGVEAQSPMSPHTFLDGLYCPKLKNLELICSYSNAPSARDPFERAFDGYGFAFVGYKPYDFLEEHGDGLERLVIGHDLYYEQDFENALMRCPNLRALQFRGMRFAEDSEIFMVLNYYASGELNEDNCGQFCTRLEYLTVTNCHIPPSTDKTLLVDMIVNLRAHEQKLEYFAIEGCNLEGFNEDPRILAVRAELERE